MKIENEFTVSVPIEQAWEVLTDLEGIAPCMPGAQLTGVEGDTYSGKLRVKVGPVISDFAGTASFVSKDETAYRAVIDAKGRDSRGSGNASASIAASLRPDGDRTVVSVATDLRIAGKLAQFGNRMIGQVSEKLLGQFVDCLEAKLAPGETQPSDGTAPVSAAAEELSGTAATAGEPAADLTAAGEPAAGESAAAASVSGEGDEPARGEAGSQGGPRLRSIKPQPEPEPVDLVQLAGGAVAKRVVPVLIGLVVIVAVVWYLIAR